MGISKIFTDLVEKATSSAKSAFDKVVKQVTGAAKDEKALEAAVEALTPARPPVMKSTVVSNPYPPVATKKKDVPVSKQRQMGVR